MKHEHWILDSPIVKPLLNSSTIYDNVIVFFKNEKYFIHITQRTL